MPGPEASSDAELIAGLQEANTALRKTNSGLRQVIDTQAVQIETLTGQIEALLARIAELERRLGSDSTTSSKPPYRKPERRSSRTESGRRPGKQPGTGGTTMPLVDNPDQTLYCDVDRCADCGGELTGAPEHRRRRPCERPHAASCPRPRRRAVGVRPLLSSRGGNEFNSAVRRDRTRLCQQAVSLQQAGLSRDAISRELGVGRETVKALLRGGKFFADTTTDPVRLRTASAAAQAQKQGTTRAQFQTDQGLTSAKAAEAWRDADVIFGGLGPPCQAGSSDEQTSHGDSSPPEGPL